ncbi:Amino-acid acetyltransferase [Carnimonas sp. R-84981]|uniref:amino-acid N-acetyltransferase n=1 Tax=Carnimonas bestiolae TaxID=3402172 RepID=UPI003EDBE4FB
MTSGFRFAEWFRGSAPYIDKHRHRTLVVLIEGGVFDGDHLDTLVQDFALLHTLGVRVVVVFGVRERVARALAKSTIEAPLIDQRMVVSAEAMEVIESESNRARLALESRFSVGLPNSPMHGLDIHAVSGNLVMARPLGVRNGVDYLQAGEVRSVRADAIQQLLDSGMLVLMPPLGHSSTGEVFDLEATDIARSVAVALKADKLVLLGDAEGLIDASGELLRQLAPPEAQQIAIDRVGNPELARHLDAACAAARGGVGRAHLLSWRDSNALLGELFTRDGVGTMITQDSYEQLRLAERGDVGGMLELMKPLEEKGVLIHRSRERLESQIEDYRVIVRDGMTIACAALHRFDEAKMGELASLVVHPDYRNGERGELLLGEIEREARLRGYHALFALTTHTSHWFLEHGFAPGTLDDLPKERGDGYNHARNSKILVKRLQEKGAA